MSKREKIYRKLMERPVRSDITWDELKSFLTGSGAALKNGKGSIRRFSYKGEFLILHEPHPQKTIKRTYIKGIQEFMKLTGIRG